MKKTVFCQLNLWKKYFNQKQQIVLFLILLIGLILRVVTALRTQLWRDEIYPLFTSRDNSLLDLLLIRHWDTAHPPLHYIFLHFWQRINYSPFFLRLPSLICSLFTLYLTPVLAKKIFSKNEVFPILALFFSSFSQNQIYFQVVNRPYSFVFFLTIISLIFFLDLLNRERFQLKDILLFSIINFFIFFTDYSGIWLLLSYAFLWFAHLIFYRERREKKINQLIFSGILTTGFFFIPILVPLIANFSQTAYLSRSNLSRFKYGDPIKNNLVFLDVFTGTTPKDTMPSVLPGKNNFLVWSFIKLAYSVAGLVALLKINKKNGLLLLILLTLPILISFSFSLFVYPFFSGENLWFVGLIIVIGIACLTSIIFKKNSILGLLIIIVWFLNFIKSFPGLYFHDPQYDYTSLIRELAKGGNKNKIALVTKDPEWMLVGLKYYNLALGLNVRYKIFNFDELDKLEANSNKIYFIQTMRYYNKGDEEDYYEEAKRLGCRLEEKQIDYFYFAECTK